MEVTIVARVDNLDKLREGRRMGETLKFPTTTEQVQALLKRIGVDGVQHQKVLLTELDSNLPGFCHCISQYDGIDEVNYLARLLSGLSNGELTTFQAVVDYGEHDGDTADLINLVLNLDCYELHPDVDTDEELGRIYADFHGAIEVPDNLQNYFDYEAYGRDVRLNEGGCFVDGGYLTRSPGSFVEQYSGPEDIPPEYRVFAYPELNIRERLTAFQKVAEQQAAKGGKPAPEHNHGNR